MNQGIYWAGLSVVASDALGVHLGVAGMLSRLLRNAGSPVRNSQFKKSWRDDWGDGYIKPRSAVVFICRLREALGDVGLPRAVQTWRSDHGDDNGSYYIDQADAKTIIEWIEERATC